MRTPSRVYRKFQVADVTLFLVRQPLSIVQVTVPGSSITITSHVDSNASELKKLHAPECLP